MNKIEDKKSLNTALYKFHKVPSFEFVNQKGDTIKVLDRLNFNEGAWKAYLILNKEDSDSFSKRCVSSSSEVASINMETAGEKFHSCFT